MIKDYKSLKNPMVFLLQWFICCGILLKNIYLEKKYFYVQSYNNSFLKSK